MTLCWFLDCWRACFSRGTSTRCATGRVVLGYRHRVHGPAIEAQHSGRPDKGSKFCDHSSSIATFLTSPLELYRRSPSSPYLHRPIEPRLNPNHLGGCIRPCTIVGQLSFIRPPYHRHSHFSIGNRERERRFRSHRYQGPRAPSPTPEMGEVQRNRAERERRRKGVEQDCIRQWTGHHRNLQ